MAEIPAEHNRPAGNLPVNVAGWLTRSRFVALFLLLLVGCFPLVFSGLTAFAYGDAGQFAYPVASYFRECFWRGELPLWNPLSSCGVPFLAQWNTLALYPGSLFYLVFPMPWSFGVFCLGHLVLAATGMYSLVLRLTNNRLAASVAGLVFGFNGFTWYGLMWPHLLAALAWMPWLVGAMRGVWSAEKERELRSIAVAGILAGLQLLSGGAEVILQTWLIIGLWMGYRIYRRSAPVLSLVGRSGVVVVLGAAIAAVQLLPFLEMVSVSQRGTDYATGGVGNIAAMPLTGWANYLVPLFHCYRNPNGVFMQVTQSWTGSYYVGTGVVLLALLGAWRSKDVRVRLLLALSAAALILAMGKRAVIYDLAIRFVPVLGLMRFPVKFVITLNFALILAAALGLNWWVRLENPVWRYERRRLIGAGLGVGGLIAAIVVWAGIAPLPGAPSAGTVQNGISRVVVLAIFIVLLSALKSVERTRVQFVVVLALVLVPWLDVFTHSSNLSPTVNRSSLAPNMVREFFHWDGEMQAGDSRAMQSKDALLKMLSTGRDDLDLDTTGRRLSLSMNYNLLDRVAKFDGLYSMDLGWFLEVFKRVYFTTNGGDELIRFLGISHVSNPTNIVDWMTLPGFLPMVTAGQMPSFADPSEALNAIFDSSFAPERVVYLPVAAKNELQEVRGAKAQISSVQVANHQIELEVDAEHATMLTVAQSYHSSWKAYVDNSPTRLWRANYAFQALAIPAGRHKVRLAYEERFLLTGAVISGASILACVGLFLRLDRSRKSGVTSIRAGS